MNNANQLVEQLNIKDPVSGSPKDETPRGQHSPVRQREINNSNESFKLLSKLASQLKGLAQKIGVKETSKANEAATKTRMQKRLKEPPRMKPKNRQELKQMELVIPKKSLKSGINPKTGKRVYQGNVALAQDNMRPKDAKEHTNLNARVTGKKAYANSVKYNPYADKFDGVDISTRFSDKTMADIIEANKDADPNSEFYVIRSDIGQARNGRNYIKDGTVTARNGPDGEHQAFNGNLHNQNTSFARRAARMLDRRKEYHKAQERQNDYGASDELAYG